MGVLEARIYEGSGGDSVNGTWENDIALDITLPAISVPEVRINIDSKEFTFIVSFHDIDINGTMGLCDGKGFQLRYV